MSLKNRYDNVIIRNNLSLGLSHNALDYVLNLEKENERLKQWDNNKDSRNSRQRIENKKLLEKNKHLQNNWNELKKWLEDEIIECKVVINTILPEFEKIMSRSSGKTLLTNEYNKCQTIIKTFEVMLSKMSELEGDKE